jgi:UDP-N-acetylmuramate--alanine ligase
MIPISAISNKKKIHFIGIGGIGMSGLAEYFLEKGYEVTGSDVTDSSIIARLRNLGAKIFIGHSERNIGNLTETVVYTSAIQKDNPELVHAGELRIRIVRRAEMLGELVNDKFLIAVSGTHGKTTTTAMIGKVLIDTGFDPLVFVGGNVTLFHGGSFHLGKGSYAVVEADEFDRSFLSLKPDIAIITSIDEDHLDIYKDLDDIKQTFRKFCENSKSGSKIIYCGDEKNINSFILSVHRDKISYGFDDVNDLKIKGYDIGSGCISFSIINSYTSHQNINIGLIGKHNVLNSTACFAVCKALDIDFERYKESIKDFSTVDRRLQLKYNENNVMVYDDYSHHPKEIEMSLRGLREFWKNKRLVSVFQPHLYSRTRDFYREFAQMLSIADKVYLMDIYPARELPIENVTSELIFNELKKINTDAEYICDKEQLLNRLSETVEKDDIIVFQGAGDISLLCDEFIKKI